jgi:hypothetical protein
MRAKNGLIVLLGTLFLFASLDFVATEALGQKKKSSGPCAQDLAHCPEHGCAPEGSPNALSNTLKRNLISVDLDTPDGKKQVKKVTFLTMKKLQKLADDLVDQNKYLDEDERAQLKDLKVGNKTYSEGDVVKISGYLVGKIRVNKGESVNCKLTGSENNDFHLPIAEIPEHDDTEGVEEGVDRSDLEYQGIVTEMIPQQRPKSWTPATLRKIQKEGKKILVIGQLFYDSKHKVNDDPQHPIGGQPKRMSLWEIHPVSRFFFCDKPNGNCNINKYEEWQELK